MTEETKSNQDQLNEARAVVSELRSLEAHDGWRRVTQILDARAQERQQHILFTPLGEDNLTPFAQEYTKGEYGAYQFVFSPRSRMLV